MSDNFNIKNNDIFNVFPKYNLEIANKYTNISSLDKEDTVEIEQKNYSKNTFLGATIASSVFTAGIGALFISKGLHGSQIKQLFGKYTKTFKEKGAQSTSKAVSFCKKCTMKVLNFLESTSNITAIKDAVFDKLCQTNGLGKKFASFTAKFEKKMVDRTLDDKYDEVCVLVSDFNSLVRKLNSNNLNKSDNSQLVEIQGVRKTLSEWCKILKEQSEKLHDGYTDGFGIAARQERCKERDELLKGTGDNIKEIFFKDGGIFKASNYNGYITENISKNAHSIMREKITAAKNKVTNNTVDICDTLKHKYIDLESILSKDNNVSLKNVEEFLDECKKLGSDGKEMKISEERINKAIEELEKLKENITNNSTVEKIDSILNDFNAIKSNSKGPLEEIMTILQGLNKVKNGENKLLSDEELKRFEQFSRGITSGMKESTEKEMEAYFIKQAEIAAGSAATDAAAIIVPTAVGAYELSKCEDNDERISSLLKTCVPLIGTFGTFVYSTTKMFSGGKSLAFSGISGFLLGKMGIYFDDLYKNYKHSGSAVQVARNEYKNVWSDIKGSQEA